MLKQQRNTLDRGRIRWIVFHDEGTWFGVAIEFNLIVEADNPDTALFELHQAVQGYVKAARKSKMRPVVLNQIPAGEYGLLWKILNRDTPAHQETSIDPKEVYSFGAIPQHA